MRILSPDASRMPSACSAEGAKAPRDYADYTTDSTFGRAAPNGRGSTDNIKKSNTQKRHTSEILLLIVKLR